MSWISLTGVISEKPKGECGRKDERCIRLKRHNRYRGDHGIILLAIRQKGESQNVGFCVGFCFLVITFWDSPFCLITEDLFTYYWPETFYKNFHIKRWWNFSPCLFFFALAWRKLRASFEICSILQKTSIARIYYWIKENWKETIFLKLNFHSFFFGGSLFLM